MARRPAARAAGRATAWSEEPGSPSGGSAPRYQYDEGTEVRTRRCVDRYARRARSLANVCSASSTTPPRRSSSRVATAPLLDVTMDLASEYLKYGGWIGRRTVRHRALSTTFGHHAAVRQAQSRWLGRRSDAFEVVMREVCSSGGTRCCDRRGRLRQVDLRASLPGDKPSSSGGARPSSMPIDLVRLIKQMTSPPTSTTTCVSRRVHRLFLSRL